MGSGGTRGCRGSLGATLTVLKVWRPTPRGKVSARRPLPSPGWTLRVCVQNPQAWERRGGTGHTVVLWFGSAVGRARSCHLARAPHAPLPKAESAWSKEGLGDGDHVAGKAAFVGAPGTWEGRTGSRSPALPCSVVPRRHSFILEIKSRPFRINNGRAFGT